MESLNKCLCNRHMWYGGFACFFPNSVVSSDLCLTFEPIVPASAYGFFDRFYYISVIIRVFKIKGKFGCFLFVVNDRQQLCFPLAGGAYPTLIAIITMFFVASSGGATASAISALLLTGLIVLSVAMTLAVSRLLSRTLLRGQASSFTLELPPYRRPQFGQVIVRSLLDRTLFVLGRAVSVAAPAGLLIWTLANMQMNGASLLTRLTQFLQPLGHLMGLDGVILLAFILGFPANEIVLPLILMGYLSSGSMSDIGNLSSLRGLLLAHGWTWLTALNVMLFSLMHFPCATTCLTIRKESGHIKWAALAFALPTVCGFIICSMLAFLVRLLNLV